MDQSFSQGIAAWNGFYTFTGTAGATLLGLLLVAVSLRLNLFHMRQVVDVRDFAVQTFGNLFYLVLIALLFLIPSQRPIGLALPLALLGLLGLLWLWRLVREYFQPNPPARRTSWRWAHAIVSVLIYGGLIVIALTLIDGRIGEALYWLIPVSVALLTTATINTWLLLAHARSGSEG